YLKSQPVYLTLSSHFEPHDCSHRLPLPNPHTSSSALLLFLSVFPASSLNRHTSPLNFLQTFLTLQKNSYSLSLMNLHHALNVLNQLYFLQILRGLGLLQSPVVLAVPYAHLLFIYKKALTSFYNMSNASSELISP